MSATIQRIGLAGLLAISLSASTPVSATSVVYCNPGGGPTDADGVKGTVTYSPPIVSQTVPVTSTATFTLTITCTAGAGKAAGTYLVELKGSASEVCSGGGAGASATRGRKTAGMGTGDVESGLWTYQRHGIHYFGFPGSGDGDLYIRETSGGGLQHYQMDLWLDLVPYVTNGGCPGAGGDIVGHAVMSDLP